MKSFHRVVDEMYIAICLLRGGFESHGSIRDQAVRDSFPILYEPPLILVLICWVFGPARRRLSSAPVLVGEN
jgi:hypothetical protein